MITVSFHAYLLGDVTPPDDMGRDVFLHLALGYNLSVGLGLISGPISGPLVSIGIGGRLLRLGRCDVIGEIGGRYLWLLGYSNKFTSFDYFTFATGLRFRCRL